MDLTHAHGSSSSSSTTQLQSKDFIDLMKEPPQHHHHHHLEDEDEEEKASRGNGISKDDIVPSYDFQPIRPLAASNNFDSAAFSRPWNSDSNSNASPPVIKNYSSLDSMEPAKVIVEKDRSAFDATMLSEIDRTMKKHMEKCFMFWKVLVHG